MTRQYVLPLPERESMGAEDFLPSESNARALAWVLRRDPSSWPSHALILWGPEGAGKTHLLSIWARRTGATFLAPHEDIFSDILENKRPQPVILDDAQRVAGDSKAEAWLQHLFNATKEAGLPFLVAARRAPALWGLRLRDIETRLKSCFAIEMPGPDDALTRGLLLKFFADRQLSVDAGVIDYLAARLERKASALKEAVRTLDAAALETGRKISVPFAQKVLMQNEPKAEDNQD